MAEQGLFISERCACLFLWSDLERDREFFVAIFAFLELLLEWSWGFDDAFRRLVSAWRRWLESSSLSFDMKF